GVLPARSRSLVPRAASVALEGGRRSLQPEEPRPDEEAARGRRLYRAARTLDHDQGIPVDVQERAGGQAAAGGGRLQDRPPGGGLGHPRAASEQARGLGRLLDGHHVQSRARLQHGRELQLAGLVVPRGQGAVDGRARPRGRSEEAPGDVGEGPDHLLRGRRARGDLGQSIFLRRPVLEAIVDRAEPTILLTLYAMLIAVAIGVPAGVLAARHHNATTDQALMAGALIGISIPNFLLGLLMILLFSVQLGWFPVAGYAPLEYGLVGPARSLTLPAFALGVVQSALIARIARSAMLDVLREQFI